MKWKRGTHTLDQANKKENFKLKNTSLTYTIII